jgi:uncharacterized SAM-binding protein YcdF (DUF218 family)
MPEVSASKPQAPAEARHKSGRIRRWTGRLFRITRNLLALAMVGLILMVLLPVPERIFYWLSVSDPTPQKADYIVCLGGGSEREGRSAQLWHRKIAPVIIVSNAPGAAEWMRKLLLECSVAGGHILVDNKSYTTRDHPAGVARLPGVDPKSHRFVIVTDHTHARRARACFVEAGYKNLVVHSGRNPRPGDSYLDSCEWRVAIMPYILYECAAIVQYWCQGHISVRSLFRD